MNLPAHRAGLAPLPEHGDAPAPKKLLYTMNEAAEATMLSRRYLEKQAKAGRLDVVRFGAAVRVRLADLEKFVNTGVSE